MLYNAVIETEITTDVTVEPVTLTEARQHMNMTFDTSGSYDFTDDNTYIIALITIARDVLERYTGLSFAPKTIKVIANNSLSGLDIPWGPNITVSSIKDVDGTTLTTSQYKIIGNAYKSISNNYSCYLEIVYTAGYAAGKLPASLKRAILEQIDFMYNNRGSQSQAYANDNVDICKSAIELATPYKRTSWLV